LDDPVNLLVFLLVLGLRLLVPLAIPRYPLAAIITAMILDAVDQTVFQQFTTLNLDNYQSYDKALDVYYLTIAYLATLRNWTNLTAVEVSRFLLYYRLVGVLVFEITQSRTALLIFPNTFEYFFIFYEAVRLRWNPRRMSPRVVLGAAAAIWIFIKLPQEYWIHVAQRDVTDTLRDNPALIPALAIAIVALLAAGWWLVTRRLPGADWAVSLADPLEIDRELGYQRGTPRLFAGRRLDQGFIEKVVLVSLVSIIFAQILPDVNATALQMTIAVALVVIGNTLVSEWLVRRGMTWKTMVREFGAMAVINVGLTILFLLILPVSAGSLHTGSTLFFLLLLTLLVLLYDHFRPYYLKRLELQNAG
jgi:hypothetical protein